MFKQTAFTIGLICLCSALLAQVPLHSWRDHYSFGKGKALCYGNNKVYCATDVGVFTFKPSTGEIDKLTKTNGLNDLDITAIKYIDGKNMLAIGYENGNIDLVYSDQIVNIPDILNKTITGSKSINNILHHNNLLYLSTGFGIVVLNTEKKEIKDTYYIGALGSKTEVYAIQPFNGRFYAATKEGILSADASNQFLYNYQNWTQEQYSAYGSNNPIIDLAASSSTLYFIEQKWNSQNCSLWKFDGSTFNETLSTLTNASSINICNNKILIVEEGKLSIYNLQDNLLATVSQYAYNPSIKPQEAIYVDEEKLAIADKSAGLAFGTISNMERICPNGISKNTSFAIATSPKYTISAAGAYNSTFSNSWTPYIVNILENNRWSEISDYSTHDAVAITFNPKNSSEYFVGSWGYGIYRYNGKTLEAHYTPENSTLQLASSNSQCRISGLCYDSKQNLWVSNPITAKPISVLKSDGTWASFSYATLINTDKVSTLHCSSDNTLWLLMPREAIFVLNPGNDINSQNDDTYKRFKPVDANGATYSVEYNAMDFDQNNYLWLGTSQGVLVCYNPGKILSTTVAFQRVKLPDVVDGFAVYLLENENVTAITVDGGNRKWIGTSKSGAFLYSADGTKEIYHFNAQNSPLPSDNILDIKVHPTTGEVFFGTEKGLVSYRGESTASSATFTNVYAYPNPVQPNFSGDISIVGLVNNTTVKITDICGNLVYETKSIGGTATWDGKNKSGHRAATGVYLVLLSNADGTEKAVTKILFIN